MKRYLKIVTLLVAPVLFLFSCSGQWENDSQGEQSYDSSENQSYTSNSSSENSQYVSSEDSKDESSENSQYVSSEDSRYVTVKFDANGGKFKDGSEYFETSLEKGEGAVEPDIPTRSNYEFIGWSLKANDASSIWNFANVITEDITFYALWEENETGIFEFTEIGGGYSIKLKTMPEDGIIDIPSAYKGKDVVEIGEYAFSNCSSLTSIVIPNSIKTIGSSAFSGCSSLESITLPFVGGTLNRTSNTHFGYIFGASSYGYNSSYVPTSLKEVIITGGVSIESSAFHNCDSLTSIVIPNSVETIGELAFSGCDSLTNVYYNGILEDWWNISFESGSSNPMSYASHFYIKNSYKEYEEVTEIVIPETITSIGDYQFWGFNNVTNITIPNSVQIIGDGAFAYCSKLTSVTFESGSKLSSIGNYTFSNCSSLTSIVIPNSVTSIGSGAFSGCSSLESITLPFVGETLNGTSNTHFGYIFGASSYSSHSNYVPTSLKEVIITGGKSIGHEAFYNCSSLTSIVIPDSVTSIGSYAFSGCSSLESITLPFVGATLNGTSNTHFGYIFGAYSYSSNSSYVPTSLKEVIITVGASIEDYAFYDCYKLTSITIPNSVKTIGDYAFRNCSSLTSVTIPNSVTSIGEFAFYGCSLLESITLPFIGETLNGTGNTHFGYIFGASSYWLNSSYVPTSLKEVIITGGTSIASNAFYKCSSLTSIVIPDSVTSIGSGAFSNCSSLTDVYYEGILEDWCKINFEDSISNPMYCASHFYIKNSSNEYEEVTEIVIPDTIASIGYQFYGFNNVTKVTIPNGVTSIGGYAFRNCSSLTSIVIPNSVTSIGNYAFYGCSSLTDVYYEGTLEDWCKINFEDSISNPMYCASHFYIKNSNNEYEEVTEIVIPETITLIGDYQFLGFTNVTKITIPNSVTSIGSGAFSGCSSLESITLPFVGETLNGTSHTHFGYIFGASSYSSNSSSVPTSLKEVIITDASSIGNWAFYGCSSLTTIVIPNGVKTIRSTAFSNCSSLTSIVIPNSVTSIGSSAFYGCSSLTSIVIPNSVTSIGINAFSNCSSLKSITLPFVGETLNGTSNTHFRYIFGASSSTDNSNYVPTSLKEVIITGGTRIASNAFYKCSSLTSIVILNNVTSIGDSAFSDCSSLTSVVIPNGVTSIGGWAFSNCSSLTSIVIPNGVTSIGSCAFFGCSSLTDVYYEGTIEDWCKISFKDRTSNPMWYASQFYIKNSNNEYEEVTEIVIPETITSIGDYQFYRFTNVTKITIPNSVTSIGSGAFCNCSSLTSIVIPDSVTSIGSNAFSNCSSLTDVYYEGTLEDWCKISFEDNFANPMYYASHFYIKNGNEYEEVTEIVIPYTITSIGDYQFYGFTNVTKITIPNSVTSIESWAFYGCSSLTDVYYEGTLEDWCKIKFEYYYSNPMYYASHFYIKNGNEYEEVTEIVIPETITSIGKYQFYGFTNVTKITIPNSVTSIGTDAFDGCSSLTSIVIPNSVTSIGGSAFYNCSSLQYNEYGNCYYLGNEENPYLVLVKVKDTSITTVTISMDTKIIMPSAFSGCSSLASIVIPDSVTSIGSYAFSGCSSLTSIVIPNNVKAIGSYAFSGCSSLTSIVIPNSIKTIGKSAFYGCSSLESITLPFVGETLNGTSNTHFRYIFGASSSTDNSNYVPTSLKEVIITGGTSIEDYAFYNCSSLTSIVIQNSVTSIGSGAFSGCSFLTSIVIPNSVETIGVHAFYNCSSLQYNEYGNCYYLGDEENPYLVLVKAKDTSITSATISENTRFIMNSAFSGCSSLTSIVIPDSVTSIGSNAFSNCSSLASIVIPNSVTSIGSNAFSGCSSLIDVYYEGTIEDWCKISLESIASNPMSCASSHFYIKNSNNEYEEVTEIVIPDTITSIGYQFCGFNNVTKVTIPNGVTSIGSGAFSNCSSLASIVIPDSVSSIGSEAFYGCSSLTSVVIPNSVTSIGDYAFRNCSSLISVTIPNSVTSIGSSAFYKCSSLTSIVIPNSVTSIGESAFFECSSLTLVTFESGSKLTAIGSCAFYGCSSLTSIVIPDSVTSIGSYSFSGCSSLESITLPFVGETLDGTSNTHFGYIFGASSSSSNSSYVPTSLKEVIITGGKSIGHEAFYNCSFLTSIVIPNSVEAIGVFAFFECSKLTIYCEASSQPREWDSTWNYSNRPVYWSEEWYYVDGVPTIK